MQLAALLHLLQQRMELTVPEGMISHVTVMVMISNIGLLLEPIEIAPVLVRLTGGIEVVNLHRVVAIVRCTVNLVMTAMAKVAATTVAAVLRAVVGMGFVSEAQIDFVGAPVQTRAVELKNHYPLRARNGFNGTAQLVKA